MLIRPHTLSLITTHQCTAACDHCCFSCTPKTKKRIPPNRLTTLIDEAGKLESVRVVVFTGGECFLLNEELDALIAKATSYGLITRSVTNGYWATSEHAAQRRMESLTKSGLKEINFSTGPFHSRYVPTKRIVYGATSAAMAGLTTVINAETFMGDGFALSEITEAPELKPFIDSGHVRISRNVWIENGGTSPLNHQSEHSRFHENRKSGCSTALKVLAVTPDLSLVSCCGLHLEKIPDLHLGSVANQCISQVLNNLPDDFLKIWIHVQGPELVLEFVKKYYPEYQLPTNSVHPCETCLHLYHDPKAKRVLQEYYGKVEDEIIQTYIASIAATEIERRTKCPAFNTGAD